MSRRDAHATTRSPLASPSRCRVCRAGLRTWRTPDVVTWTELVRRAFEADREAGRTTCRWLAPGHAQLVWEQIVRGDERLHAVIAPAGIGAMAFRSWTLLHEYLIPHARARDR